ncbi:MAG: hypothetical protein V8Q36_02320 [Anaerotignum sp.]
METRQINVMGKMVEIAEGATFADVAKDFSSMVDGPIMLARQKNKLRELHQKIRTCDDVTFYGIENDEAMRVYRRGVLILMTKAVYELWGNESLVVVEHSLQKNLYCEIRKPEMEITKKCWQRLKAKCGNMWQQTCPSANAPCGKKMPEKSPDDRACPIRMSCSVIAGRPM